MRVVELRGFHLDDRVRKNVAIVPLQMCLLEWIRTASSNQTLSVANAGIVVTWGWTISLVVVETGLALIHQVHAVFQ